MILALTICGIVIFCFSFTRGIVALGRLSWRQRRPLFEGARFAVEKFEPGDLGDQF
jgi:hypothetical protein